MRRDQRFEEVCAQRAEILIGLAEPHLLLSDLTFQPRNNLGQLVGFGEHFGNGAGHSLDPVEKPYAFFNFSNLTFRLPRTGSAIRLVAAQ